MKKLCIIANKLFDIFELYIPNAAFIVLIVSYIILISYRYIFYASMDWLYELNVVAFVWCSILAASYGSRSGKHVAFSIIYDKFSEKTQLILRLIGELLAVGLFFFLLPRAYNSIDFMAIRKTPIMAIPFNIVYFPFVIFVVLTLIHNVVLLSKDIKICIGMIKARCK